MSNWKEVNGILVQMAEQGTLKTVRQVFDELEKYPDCYNGLKDHKDKLIVPVTMQYTPKVQTQLDILAEKAPKLYEEIGISDPADPWLIAVAKVHGFTVVTEESITSPIKIPAVCKSADLNCECITSPHLLYEIGIIKEFKPQHVHPDWFYKNGKL